MSEVLTRIDRKSPWLYGALGFVTWILTAVLIGVVSGEGAAEAVDVPMVVGALTFAVVVIYSERRSTRRSTSN